ncbi:MAG TPA: cytochrome c oxidase accessory protein CcoG [Burkholderiales bacterium]|nr:cytochrome c oxidase accessory protein CcoG [Burkholderiales bacterium]
MPEAAATTELYAADRKIYPRAVHGWFAAWRWMLVWATQLVFYGGAWLTWNGRQAVLFDIVQRKFYVFGLVFWPQDVIYLAILLIISALSLFLFTTVAGRLWCGYACPQTVYTEIFMWIERLIEGDRSRRMKLDGSVFSARKAALKGAKHAAWIALALWTGFTFVGYFTPIRELWAEVTRLSTGPWEAFWMLFYGFATYGNAGWMREQVCTYMCPYARFQSAMFDKDTLTITYDQKRGEPRGPRARRADSKALGLGDCVDCNICVQVCPTGIDIRDGLQYQCIGCAACIDGCNQVMDKMGYPRGLIRYSTQNAMERKLTGTQMIARTLRPRVLAYTAIVWAVIVATVLGLYLRVPLKVDVMRDRAAIAREVGRGDIENVYQLRIMNTSERTRVFDIEVSGLPGLHLEGGANVQVHGAASRLVPVRARVHVEGGPVGAGTHRIEFLVRARDEPAVRAHEKSVFVVR